ncbi:AGAP000978-PA [Anopheles gambiae str. PEST]|uniref:Origin recognition complex subunit 5 n=2 Tax=gambiae species complex TaxID=44542 RepID=Q7PSW9_ANOGA|nr:origin recognition complex subunit 5 [Anopheles coluzzii]XP_309174.2 origin recognition complex subunit 5 [Anopheles gambiae]EAA04918.3 AGAP000978-PA [Anopheles gambiae str. PEST]
MEAFVKQIAGVLPCRDGYVRQLYRYYRKGDQFPPALYIYGQSSTGKGAILREVFRCRSAADESLRCAQLSAISCYTNKILFETIVRQLEGAELSQSNHYSIDCKLEYAKDFLAALRQRLDPARSYVIVVRHAERLRDMAHNLLPLFLQLPEATGLNVSVVLVSSLPFEKFYTKAGLPPVVKLFVAEYTRADMQRILMNDYAPHVQGLGGQRSAPDQLWLAAITEEFHRNYVSLFLGTFWKVCRDVKELRLVAAECFPAYCEPVRDGTIPAHDSMKLWRNITKTLRAALSTMYMRIGTKATGSGVAPDGTAWLAQNLELPYYAKYLLIAAYLASNNAAKEDRRLFMKNHGKQRKRMQAVNARAKVTEKMTTKLGPKAFNVDRLLAIFYAILDEQVGLTCNLLAQISTLVHLKLLTYASSAEGGAGGSAMLDGSATRLQCTVGMDFILQIGRMVGFNVRQYLTDFF